MQYVLQDSTVSDKPFENIRTASVTSDNIVYYECTHISFS